MFLQFFRSLGDFLLHFPFAFLHQQFRIYIGLRVLLLQLLNKEFLAFRLVLALFHEHFDPFFDGARHILCVF